MSAPVTICELLRRIPEVNREQLGQACSEKHLWEVAKKLGQWRLVAPLLDFSDADVAGWEHDSRHDEEGRRQIMLTKWRQRAGRAATYETLAEVLLKAERTDLAELLLKLLKGEKPWIL